MGDVAEVIHDGFMQHEIKDRQRDEVECRPVLVSGPVLRPKDETHARCFTNRCLRIQHDRR